MRTSNVDPPNSRETCGGVPVQPLPIEDAERFAPIFKALGDPARLRMVSMIASAPELCVCDIAPAFDLASGTISHHLKILREAGIIESERRGTFVYYWIQPDTLNALAALLSRP